MNPPLAIGTVLYGFCHGCFGRDSYEDKRIEAMGADWIVCRDGRGDIHFATFRPGESMVDILGDCTTPKGT